MLGWNIVLDETGVEVRHATQLSPRDFFKYLGFVPPKLKRKFYRVVVKLSLLYRVECWPVKNSHVQKIYVLETRMLR
ncbi:hypothetical protein H5410_052388 [Solanum commersonii]|uniref:Uncharacterized protein n=1 Tax=Solanum commersonii TaxID=4109 RepID=A0A9J5X0P9_SOLCO|nr:hypothetical protein H5410_052388 [Solanum commersonii]